MDSTGMKSAQMAAHATSCCTFSPPASIAGPKIYAVASINLSAPRAAFISIQCLYLR